MYIIKNNLFEKILNLDSSRKTYTWEKSQKRHFEKIKRDETSLVKLPTISFGQTKKFRAKLWHGIALHTRQMENFKDSTNRHEMR